MKRSSAGQLGVLESAVMDHMWSRGACDVKAVHHAIGTDRGVTLNTVQTTMQRLHRKGLLARHKVSHAYVSRPSVSREAFSAQAIQQIVESFLHGDDTPMFSAFVDLAERAGDEQLEALERMISARRRQRKAPGT